ncbi:MAG: outer rane cation efflux system protein, partial [Paucimonas sp.]|nr:outer rane cation efflux system protein [Paucimonas sp.]
RRGEADAAATAAASWIAGSPVLGVSQRDDRWHDDRGRRESEVSLSAPVWLPGQKSAHAKLARATTHDAEAQIAHLRLRIAGEVRERLWAALAARESLVEAEDHLEHVEGYAKEVLQRVAAGDMAHSDGLLAKQEALLAQGAVSAARMSMNEAFSRYTLFTGMEVPPEVEPETIATFPAEPHPQLSAANSALDRALAAHEVAARSRSEAPTIGVSMRREQDSGGIAPARSVGVSLQMPIGTPARNRPLLAAAYTQLSSARADVLQAESALKADIALAREQLAAARNALEIADARATHTREHESLIEKAFRLGERGLADLLRARALAHEAEAAARRHKVALGLTYARLNQALGVFP